MRQCRTLAQGSRSTALRPGVLQVSVPPPHRQSAAIRYLMSRGLALLHIFGLTTCHSALPPSPPVTGSSEPKPAPVPGACYLLVCRTPHLAAARSPRDSYRSAWSPHCPRSTAHSHHFHLRRSAARSCLRKGEDSLRGLCRASRQATVVVVLVPLGYGTQLWTIEADLASPALRTHLGVPCLSRVGRRQPRQHLEDVRLLWDGACLPRF